MKLNVSKIRSITFLCENSLIGIKSDITLSVSDKPQFKINIYGDKR